MQDRLRVCLIALVLTQSHGALVQYRPPSSIIRVGAVSRRESLGLLGLGLFAFPEPAKAFPNAVPDYAKFADKPKRPGTPPKDLGVAKRTIRGEDFDDVTFQGLRGCDGKPNCFSTTGDILYEDRLQQGVDTLIKPWRAPASDTTPLKTLATVVKEYPPGQGFIDGGGFMVIKETDSYLYVQYEALKKGYIDDVEWLAGKNGVITLRSSSRVGQTDFGVNAKRLNYIGARLREKGWEIEEITRKTHKDYFDLAEDAADQTFDTDRRRGTGLEDKRLERGLGASAPSV